MKEVYISLPAARQVQDFVETITPLEGEFELVSGPYLLDARSLMGIFTLDLGRPILLRIYNSSAENMRAIGEFVTDSPAQ